MASTASNASASLGQMSSSYLSGGGAGGSSSGSSVTANSYNGFRFAPSHHLPHPHHHHHHHQLSYIEEYHHYHQQQRNKYDDISLFRNNFVNIF